MKRKGLKSRTLERRRKIIKTSSILESLRWRDNDDSDTEYRTKQPQLELILKRTKHYRDSFPLPFELLLKIFKCVVDNSNYPLVDLYNLASVAESWRQIIINSPTLWTRIDFSQLPITDRNLNTLAKIFQDSPRMINHVEEVSFGGSIQCREIKTALFIETLLNAPNLSSLSINALKQHNRISINGMVVRSIAQCKKLRSLSITESRLLFNNQKWICDHLVRNGRQLEVLNLAMSLSTISNQLFKAIDSNFCPNIKVLDISTCDALETHSFDAIQLARNMPNLEVLRVGNVSFKKVNEIPEILGLKKLKELSMPKSMRDLKRDDKLVITLTYGSESISTLDLRGAAIAPCVLFDMPSYELKELHIDDIYALQRYLYYRFIGKWSKTLEVLSLVKINCAETVRRCLEALVVNGKIPKLRELDLSTSDVTAEALVNFLRAAKKLESIDLTACRSLPRGCKCQFNENPKDSGSKKLDLLREALDIKPVVKQRSLRLRSRSN